MIEPIAATVAGLDPEIAPKNAQAKIVTVANPPRVEPTMLIARRINLEKAPTLHKTACQNKEWHSHKRKGINGTEHALC